MGEHQSCECVSSVNNNTVLKGERLLRSEEKPAYYNTILRMSKEYIEKFNLSEITRTLQRESFKNNS